MAKGVVLGLIFGALIGEAGVRIVDRTQGRRMEEAGAKVGEEAAKAKGAGEETARLSDAQAKALKDWGTVYSVNVDPAK